MQRPTVFIPSFGPRVVLSLMLGCGGGPSAEELCEATLTCLPPGLDRAGLVAECVPRVQRSLDRAAEHGCSAEADDSNRCTLDALEASSACGVVADFGACPREYDALLSCYETSGATVDFACDQDFGCVEFFGNTAGPSLCEAFGSPSVAACPGEDRVGRCDTPGVVARQRSVRHYYVDDLVSVETVREQCANEGGTWTDG